MSVGPSSFGIIGGIASTPSTQRTASKDAANSEANRHAGETKLDEAAAEAAGIGKTDADHETDERDADGRMLWERQHGKKKQEPPAPTTTPETPHLSIDTTGTAGGSLDLVG
jgi:hypothetical protein